LVNEFLAKYEARDAIALHFSSGVPRAKPVTFSRPQRAASAR
jgi:hypothetical protein